MTIQYRNRLDVAHHLLGCLAGNELFFPSTYVKKVPKLPTARAPPLFAAPPPVAPPPAAGAPASETSISTEPPRRSPHPSRYGGVPMMGGGSGAGANDECMRACVHACKCVCVCVCAEGVPLVFHRTPAVTEQPPPQQQLVPDQQVGPPRRVSFPRCDVAFACIVALVALQPGPPDVFPCPITTS